jgi:hypothetical protein
MKPDWKDAPEWAKYVAQDSDETWWWYEAEPIRGNNGNWSNANRTKYEQAYSYGPVEERP